MKPFLQNQRFGFEAATALPPAPPPKLKGTKQFTVPSFLTTLKPSPASALQRKDRGLANLDLTTYRTGSDSRTVISDFARASPELSAAVTAYIRTGITKGYTAIARNPDGTVNPEATSALAQVLTRMDVLNDYTIGFDDSNTIRSTSEIWARELVTMGACCGELVLDKQRLPDKVQPIASSTVDLFPTSDGRKRIPKQKVSGEYISLDIPTFFMIRIDEDLREPYPISPIESAVQAVIFNADFMNDLRRVVKKAIHPRVMAVVDEEKFLKSMPLDIKQDQAKVDAYYEQVIIQIRDRINGLDPDEAMVYFDSIGVSVMDHGNTNLANEYTVLGEIGDAKVASGAKVLPTALGKGGGSSNSASTEALLFVKYVEGTVWAKLNEMWSKILTLAVRLLGYDVTVSFTYDAINLKPDDELEAFKAMKQSRLLELLSLGFISDEEAAISLTGHLPPPGMAPLSGTGFHKNTATPAGDGYNGASNSGSAFNQKTAPETPTAPKSKNGGKSAEILHLNVE